MWRGEMTPSCSPRQVSDRAGTDLLVACRVRLLLYDDRSHFPLEPSYRILTKRRNWSKFQKKKKKTRAHTGAISKYSAVWRLGRGTFSCQQTWDSELRGAGGKP